ncbi:MAG: carboxypeptidase-like regulatory domain-containing protein [Cyclobacteriaceae bacterium]
MNTTNKKSSLLCVVAVVFVTVSVGCHDNDDSMNPEPTQISATISGSVKDESGHAYPKTLVSISKGSKKQEKTTNSGGLFDFTLQYSGMYEVMIVPPLATETITEIPAVVHVQADQTSTVDIVIQPQALTANLNFGDADIFGEVKDEDGKRLEQVIFRIKKM